MLGGEKKKRERQHAGSRRGPYSKWTATSRGAGVCRTPVLARRRVPQVKKKKELLQVPDAAYLKTTKKQSGGGESRRDDGIVKFGSRKRGLMKDASKKPKRTATEKLARQLDWQGEKRGESAKTGGKRRGEGRIRLGGYQSQLRSTGSSRRMNSPVGLER